MLSVACRGQLIAEGLALVDAAECERRPFTAAERRSCEEILANLGPPQHPRAPLTVSERNHRAVPTRTATPLFVRRLDAPPGLVVGGLLLGVRSLDVDCAQLRCL